MTKNFRKKTKNLMKKIVREIGLKMYKMKIYIGECSKDDVITICDFLLDMWLRITGNHLNVFFRYFAGYTRELIIEIDGEVARPYLYFNLFADKKNMPKIEQLRKIAFFSLIKINSSGVNLVTYESGKPEYKKGFEIAIPVEETPPEQYDQVLDNLMLPCIRVIKENKELEELLDSYQYNKQLCSRGGIMSRKNLECNVALEMER
jgi:hypothetical protein